MTAVWPSVLPKPLRDDYSHSFVESRLVKNTDGGPPGYRRRFSSTLISFNISIDATVDQLAAFEYFFEVTLKVGTLPFIMEHPVYGGVPAYDADGDPILTDDDELTLLSADEIFLFGQSMPQVVPFADRYKISFNVLKMP